MKNILNELKKKSLSLIAKNLPLPNLGGNSTESDSKNYVPKQDDELQKGISEIENQVSLYHTRLMMPQGRAFPKNAHSEQFKNSTKERLVKKYRDNLKLWPIVINSLNTIDTLYEKQKAKEETQ